jgi:hypothetical protein
MSSLVRVHFIDKSCKTFGIEPNATCAQLRDIVVSRIGLKEDSCFALFEKKGDLGNFPVLSLLCHGVILNSFTLRTLS